MAQKLLTEGPYVFGSDDPCEIKIDGGPGDLDLWLCFRGTINEVTFYLERETTYPQFHPNNRRSFMPAKIFGMRKQPFTSGGGILELAGFTFKGSCAYFFKMSYNPQDRKGTVWFPNKGTAPKS